MKHLRLKCIFWTEWDSTQESVAELKACMHCQCGTAPIEGCRTHNHCIPACLWLRVSAHREHEDRRIVNSRIG